MANIKYNPYLAQLFSGSIISELASEGVSNRFREVVSSSGVLNFRKMGMTYRSIFNEVYSYLRKSYRIEYFYKNTIAKELLLKRHSLRDASMLSEFRVGMSKADVVILNGTTTAYEIKTDYDDLDRLNAQLTDYTRVFDDVYVVSSQKMLENVLKEVSVDIGVIVLTDKDEIFEVRKSMSHKSRINSDLVIDSLRKPEVEKIIKDCFGQSLMVPNTKFYSTARILLQEIPSQLLHEKMLGVLRSRADKVISDRFVGRLPQCLKFAGLTTGLNEVEQDSFGNVLQLKFQPS
ncbi:MAG: hypothetical protein A2298_00560 [Gammaproteobacteria bacterium RIFOXYB2_FULL_38_6]|nr:MAG: hypothetical protein A2298_00560 [Gammaproteobacteria bacterium RIFOXYB2_FULL_38_6]